ncbi:MAG TPA: tRNA pseudouridine(38-40) synthase TruA [Erysipelothrix sp.]|nr:tRNA pseudouridine(38-40) synthase TruA [Erysipelothrix sp.]
MRYKASVTYNGSSYHGWQTQPDKQSIQSEIERALSIIHKEETSITASGRTDRNVHALNQVFHFDSDLDLKSESWVKAINTHLPKDIRIKKVIHVDEDFHARFDATSKTYHYKLNTRAFDVFTINTITQYNQPLNLNKLKEASTLFIGKHDFTSFNKTPLSVIEGQTRTITTFDVLEKNGVITFIIKGDGFLRHMIRMLVATTIAYSEDKITLEKIDNALKHPSKNKIKYNIEGNGLYLVCVDYD